MDSGTSPHPAPAALKAQYQVLVSGSAETLEMQVNEAITQGWKPLGGISVAQSFQSSETGLHGGTVYDTEYTYAQAMTMGSDPAVIKGSP